MLGYAFDRMTEGMTEIEQLADSILMFVFGNDFCFDGNAVGNHAFKVGDGH